MQRPSTSKQVKSEEDSEDNNKIPVTDESKGRSSAGKLLAIDDADKGSTKLRNLAGLTGNSSTQSQGHLKKARASLKQKFVMNVNNNGMSS